MPEYYWYHICTCTTFHTTHTYSFYKIAHKFRKKPTREASQNKRIRLASNFCYCNMVAFWVSRILREHLVWNLFEVGCLSLLTSPLFHHLAFKFLVKAFFDFIAYNLFADLSSACQCLLRKIWFKKFTKNQSVCKKTFWWKAKANQFFSCFQFIHLVLLHQKVGQSKTIFDGLGKSRNQTIFEYFIDI